MDDFCVRQFDGRAENIISTCVYGMVTNALYYIQYIFDQCKNPFIKLLMNVNEQMHVNSIVG